MKIRDAVSTDMKHGGFWKAERLLQHAQHAALPAGLVPADGGSAAHVRSPQCPGTALSTGTPRLCKGNAPIARGKTGVAGELLPVANEPGVGDGEPQPAQSAQTSESTVARIRLPDTFPISTLQRPLAAPQFNPCLILF